MPSIPLIPLLMSLWVTTLSSRLPLTLRTQGLVWGSRLMPTLVFALL
jgi:hypothetical protein